MSSHPELFSGGVLRITVHHVYYPVTEETLQQVFVAYGVVKISVFQRINHVEVVVQLRSRRGAARALALHGRCIYERACLLDIQDVSPEYNLHLCSLLELKQTATVAEYTTAFWERVHRVLDLNSTLSIKCFVHQYIDGLRTDIQAAVQSQSPSSITRASSLARIREEEIMKDGAMGAEDLDNGYDHGVHGLTPTETLTDVSPELAFPVECRSHDAAALMSAVSATATPTSSMAPMPVTYSTGGLSYGDVNSPVAMQMLRPSPWPSFVVEHTSTARSSIVEPPLSATTAPSSGCVMQGPDDGASEFSAKEIARKVCTSGVESPLCLELVMHAISKWDPSISLINRGMAIDNCTGWWCGVPPMDPNGKCSSEKSLAAPLYCSEQFQWVIAWELYNDYNGSPGHILVLTVNTSLEILNNPYAAPMNDGVQDIWISWELPCGTHHGVDLMLLGSNQQCLNVEAYFLEHDGVGSQCGYAILATGYGSTIIILSIHRLWDPGGSPNHWDHIIGLRTSRNLRGRECHAPVLPLGFL